MAGRLSAVLLLGLAVEFLATAPVEAQESQAEWQARVDALKKKYDAKKQAVVEALDTIKRAQRKLDDVRVFGNPNSPTYEGDFNAATSELESAQSAWRSAVDDRDESFREYDRVRNSPPRPPARPPATNPPGSDWNSEAEPGGRESKPDS